MIKKIKKYTTSIIVIIILIFLALLIEIFIFNKSYWDLDSKDRNYKEINIDSAEMKNINNKNGTFVIESGDNSFKIKKNQEIIYLTIVLKSKNINDLKVGVGETELSSEKSSFYKCKYENFFSIPIDKKLEDVYFYIKSVDDKYPKELVIDKIIIDNRLYPNAYRVVFFVVVFTLLYYFIVFRKIAFKKLHITFVVIALSIGIILILTIPYGYSWDEPEHFKKAYNISSGYVDVIDHNQVAIPQIFDLFSERGPSNTFRQKVEQLKISMDSKYVESRHLLSTAKGYTAVPYIGASIAIGIAKVLNIPFLMLFYIGKLGNLIIYILIGYYVIKNIKIGKRICFLILLFPTSLFLASSYSADPITTVLCMLLLKFSIDYLYKDDNSLRWRDMLPFFVTTILITACKPTYVPIVFLVFIIKKSKFTNKKFNILKKFTITIVSFLFGGLLYIYTDRFHEVSWLIEGADSSLQIKYILNNPIEFINNFLVFMLDNLGGFLQGSISSLAYVGSVSPYWFIIIFTLLIINSIISKESDIRINNLSRGVIITSFVACSGLIYLALFLSFTPVGSSGANGVQARYFIPLFILLFMSFKNKEIKINNIEKTEKTINIINVIIMSLANLESVKIMISLYYM